MIDAKKQYGEYLVGKLYTHPDVIDVMLEELGDFLKQAGPADDQGEEEVEEVVVVSAALRLLVYLRCI